MSKGNLQFPKLGPKHKTSNHSISHLDLINTNAAKHGFPNHNPNIGYHDDSHPLHLLNFNKVRSVEKLEFPRFESSTDELLQKLLNIGFMHHFHG